jgi:branched-chain amino acid transport system ATP-binding protein
MEVMVVRNISKSFGGLRVLRNVSFSLKAGEKVALIGPNGAGKTTLINVLSGLLKPTSGNISFLGHDITKLPPYERTALGIARSFQISSIFPALSLFTNVLIALYGVQKTKYQIFRRFTSYKKNNDRARELLESIDLWDKRDLPVNKLSHGEKRRLEIILSISSQPKILLLDEPTAGLSIAETSSLIDMINNLAKGTTTLVVAHDLDFIYQLCDRVMVLYYGEIIADGPCEVIKVHPKVREIYLGIEAKDA